MWSASSSEEEVKCETSSRLKSKNKKCHFITLNYLLLKVQSFKYKDLKIYRFQISLSSLGKVYSLVLLLNATLALV